MPVLRAFAAVPHFLHHEVLLETHSTVSVLPSDRYSISKANYTFPLAPQRKVGTYGQQAFIVTSRQCSGHVTSVSMCVSVCVCARARGGGGICFCSEVKRAPYDSGRGFIS